ncbi:MAG: hypothetical protein IT378_01725 [Sandaracinaceae bacterium]|nr:hypothetical protein [Sandaracinaceae bacterium]
MPTRKLALLFCWMAAGCTETAVLCPPDMILETATRRCVPISEVPDGALPPDAGQDAGGMLCGSVICGAGQHCNAAEQCVDCLTREHCGGDTPECNSAGVCVECLDDTHCNDPLAAQCGTDGECVPCDDSDQCDGIVVEGRVLGVCDEDTGSPFRGQCVECTATSNSCSARACTRERRCSAYDNGQTVCEPCDTDANCETDHFCVPMMFGVSPRPTGYCLKSVNGGCVQPYAIQTPVRETLSGVGGMTFCGINESFTTCEAVLALDMNARCDSGMDSECPEGGLCRTVGTLANRCTYECNDAAQCLDPARMRATACGGGPPTFCR